MEGQLKKIASNSNSNNNNNNSNNQEIQNNNEFSEQNLMKQFIEFNQNYQQHQQIVKNGNINHNSATIRQQNNKNSSSNSNISQKILDDWLENCIREQNYPFIQANQMNGNSNSINNNNSNNYDNNFQSIKMNKKYSSDINSSTNRNHQPNHYQHHQQNHNHPSSTSQQNLLTVDYLYNGIGPNHLDKYRKNFHLTETSINQEFMSLPPGINLIQYNNSNGSSSNNNNNNNGCNSPKTSTLTDGNNINNNNSSNNNNNYSDILINEFEKSRRYSDPGLGGIVINFDEDDSKSSDNENLDKKFHSSAAATVSGANNETNTKMLTLLLEQIHMLHETNTKICRNLQETKVEVEALKNAPPSWPHRHRKDSISGFSSYSQPLNFNMGNQSPMPTYQSGMYTPGLLTDVVREVRDAARVREEALLNRVRSLVDERQWASNDNRLKMMKDVEDLKVQVLQLRTDKKDLNHQIIQMETEIKSLKSFLTFVLTQNNARSMFPSSGGIAYPPHHNQPHPHLVETVEQAYQIEENCNDFPESVKRFANINISNGDGGGDDVFHNLNDSGGSSSNNGYKNNKMTLGSPDGQIINLERDNILLRRELQNARTVTNNSEYRIKKLENMVATLQTKVKPEEQISDTLQTQKVAAKSSPGTLNKISLSKILEYPKVTNHKTKELQMGIQVQDVTPFEVHINHSGPVTDL